MTLWKRRMTLDEAITYCDEKAKEYKEKERYELMGEYLQFRAWVKELKRLRESERPTGEWIFINRAKDASSGVCSCCRGLIKPIPLFEGELTYDYCPLCGAKMERGEEE